MAPMQLVISGVLTLIIYGLGLFAVYRVFQISNDVSEIKNLLREIKRNNLEAPAAVPAAAPLATPVPQSAEALVRAVHESYKSAFED